MKRTLYLYLILIIVPLSLVRAQFDDLGFDTDKFSIRIVAGPSASYPMGSDLDNTRDQHEAFENQDLDPFLGTYTEVNAGFVPLLGFHAGTSIEYEFSEQLGIEVGILFYRRGYNSTFKTLYEDFEYQYDEEDLISNRIIWNTLDIPILATYKLTEWFTVIGGIQLMNTQSLKRIDVTKETVWINSKKDDGYSSKDEDETDLDALKTNSVALTLGLETRISDTIHLRLSAQRSGNMFSSDLKIQNLTLNFSAIYQLNELF